jgi:hypothetical protein
MGGWIFEPEPDHVCSPPSRLLIAKKPVGSVWQCGECTQNWMVHWDNEAKKKEMLQVSNQTAAKKMLDFHQDRFTQARAEGE